jgi:hypothetical protein
VLDTARTVDNIMWRWLLPWFASLLVVLACWLPAGRAQAPPPHAPAPAAPAENPADRSFVLPWAVAAACTIVILLIVCMPSRKG